MDRPKIVCIGGSTKFKDTIIQISKELTLQGYIVLGIFIFKEDKSSLTEEQIDILFNLQLKRIDICDILYIINVSGYIGDSTRSEINYAIAHNKPVRYLEEVKN